MQLFNTKVIRADEDVSWDIPEYLPGLADKKLLVISTPFEDGSPESLTLDKMMAACKLAKFDYEVIQLSGGARLSWSMLRGQGAPERLLLAGVNPAQLGINAIFLPHSCNAFLGAVIIPTASLTEIDSQPSLKRTLWESGLKPCFSL